MKVTTILSVFFFLITFPLFGEWSDDPSANTAVCTLSGEQAIPKVGTGPTGDTYIGFFSNEEGNYNVRLQRYDFAGNALWQDGGILISDNTSMSYLTDWDMTVDQDNYAILTFQDIRTGSNNIFAYRISPEGTSVWGDDGLQLSNTTTYDAAPKVTVTTDGNIVIAWGSEDVSRIQRISPDGTLQWGTTGIEITGSNSYTWPQPIAAENDHVIVKYYDDTGPSWSPTRYIYAQKYDANGNASWAQPCAISTAGGITAWTQDLPVIPDENYGFFIGWYDDRDSNQNADVYVQHVDSSGTCLFTDNGLVVSTNYDNEHYYPYLAYLENIQILYVYWNEMDADQNNRGIYGQKVDMAGTRKWGDTGRSIIALSSTNVYPVGIGNTSDNVFVFFEEGTNDQIIRAMALDSDGDFVWADEIVTMCSVVSSKVHDVVGPTNSSQWIASWEDDRSGSADIYAQNINSDGTLGYIPVAIEPEYSEETSLLNAVPNPFSASTTISFNKTTESTENTEINIYNIKGQLVRNLPVNSSPSLFLEVTWDGKGEKGKEVKSGVYFYKIKNDAEQVGKVVKLR